MKTDRILILVLALLFFVAIMPKSCAQVMLPHRRSVGAVTSEPYVANTAVFDGTNDYMRLTSGGPPGLSDSAQFTFSCWVKFDDQGTTKMLFNVGASNYQWTVYRLNDNTIIAAGRNNANIVNLNIGGSTAITELSGWTHVYVCVDTSDSGLCKIYVNGVADSVTFFTFLGGNINMVDSTYTYTIGADWNNAGKLEGTLSEMWINDTYLDDPTKFAVGGCPIDLGINGELPTGASPVFYFKDAGNDFDLNYGTGGNFTITGSLDTTTSPCP